ncbi:MAG: glutathione S-transferase family protein [Gammaproteobacteria bacterium]
MKLYGSLASPFVARVVLFARIKGLDLAPQMPPGGHIKSPEYLALNPIGKMPALEVDGRVLPESEVICEYLEEAFPGKSGLPADPFERARARLLSRLNDLYIYAHTGVLFRNMNPATRNQAEVGQATAALDAAFGYVEHFMGAGPYAVGNALTLADCALIPGFVLLKKLVFPAYGIADPTAGAGKLGRWWQACAADPTCSAFFKEYDVAFAEMMKAMAAPPK